MFEKKHTIVIGKERYFEVLKTVEKYTDKCIEIYSGHDHIEITFQCNAIKYMKLKNEIFKNHIEKKEA